MAKWDIINSDNIINYFLIIRQIPNTLNIFIAKFWYARLISVQQLTYWAVIFRYISNINRLCLVRNIITHIVVETFNRIKVIINQTVLFITCSPTLIMYKLHSTLMPFPKYLPTWLIQSGWRWPKSSPPESRSSTDSSHVCI